MYRRALAVSETSYGPDHPRVAVCLNNLALLLRETNRPSEAEPFFQKALGIQERSYGPDHPTVATTLNNFALVLKDTHRLHMAEPLFRRALLIIIRCGLATGYGHPSFALSQSNYGCALRDLGRTQAEIDAALNSIAEEAREPPS
jgi:hypothetical protein